MSHENNLTFRIHPAIGLARVGNSQEFYLGPETIAGMPQPGKDVTGGLPIKPGTEDEHIQSSDLRDAQGSLKRQAARFRVYVYDKAEVESYPNGGGREVGIGDEINGKKIQDIYWTVHLANKKAQSYTLEVEGAEDLTMLELYEDGKTPPLRNENQYGSDPNNERRLRELIIDPGPRTIHGTEAEPVWFDQETEPNFFDSDSGEVLALPNYPVSFPDMHFKNRRVLYDPVGPIISLGELRTDEKGRLLVVGSFGRVSAFPQEIDPANDNPYPLNGATDNDGWFDDTGDGPVNATLVFTDGSTATVHGAWAVATDPSFAPQVPNIVSLWDDIYDTFIRELNLRPDIYPLSSFNPDYVASWEADIFPFLNKVPLQMWSTNLPKIAQQAHDAVGQIQSSDDPDATIIAGLNFIRNPNNDVESDIGAPLMPLSLGDQAKSFLSPSLTQYFFLEQWSKKQFDADKAPPMGRGEFLDMAVLANCLGGRFSPGIDMTYIVRLADLWVKSWEISGGGPFRIKEQSMNYLAARKDQPFLDDGFVPIHSGASGCQPGDTSKFMALPWHCDYNSCATHTPSPNVPFATTLYWSWPAQRPVTVYRAVDVQDGQLGDNFYSMRGPQTESENFANQGRYQEYIDYVKNWSRVGFIIQGTAVDASENGPLPANYYLEVQSQMPDEPSVPAWPINALNNSE